MAKARKNPEIMTPAPVVDVYESKVRVGRVETLHSCVGNPKYIKSFLVSLDKLCKDFKFTDTEFIRPLRAFRLYVDNNGSRHHVDWISLDELSKKYKLRIPLMKGGAGKYQPPIDRKYR